MPDTLFTNASLVLDGFAERQAASHVLVKGGTIHTVSLRPLERGDATVIDVAGRTLMPGLIDAHCHITGPLVEPQEHCLSRRRDRRCRSALPAQQLDGRLHHDPGGGWRRLLDRPTPCGRGDRGPRLFYSGRALTQTGGGADFRTPAETNDPGGHASPFSVMSVIVDGVDEVRRAAREELRRGATQIKLFASGGVVFPSESHATIYEFSDAELRAAVEEATARGTYVMAHVYTDEGVRRCLRAGVRSIEHANFVSQDTVAMMADHRVYFDPTFISLVQRIESAGDTHLPDRIVRNLEQTVARGQEVYEWAKQRDLPIAFGTDLWGPEAQKSQLREFETRAGLDSPAAIIRSATAINAELLKMKDKLGVIAPGAYADLLVVDGDPLTDLRVMTDPRRNLKVIMKDGMLYKNELG